jgi:hypothetical protein
MKLSKAAKLWIETEYNRINSCTESIHGIENTIKSPVRQIDILKRSILLEREQIVLIDESVDGYKKQWEDA